MRFRLETAYGDPKARPVFADISAYAQWAAEMRRLQAASQRSSLGAR